MRTVEGRELLFRIITAGERPQVQVAFVSTYGNIMEAVTLEASDVLGLARAAGKVATAAQRHFEARLATGERTAVNERIRAAFERGRR